jgi:hypothetical protein
MDTVFVVGASGILGWAVLAAGVALSYWPPTRVFRIAVVGAIIGGMLGLLFAPVAPFFAFSVGAAIAGTLSGAVCAVVLIIDRLSRS